MSRISVLGPISMEDVCHHAPRRVARPARVPAVSDVFLPFAGAQSAPWSDTRRGVCSLASACELCKHSEGPLRSCVPLPFPPRSCHACLSSFGPVHSYIGLCLRFRKLNQQQRCRRFCAVDRRCRQQPRRCAGRSDEHRDGGVPSRADPVRCRVRVAAGRPLALWSVQHGVRRRPGLRGWPVHLPGGVAALRGKLHRHLIGRSQLRWMHNAMCRRRFLSSGGVPLPGGSHGLRRNLR
jgi:hypothetical protein